MADDNASFEAGSHPHAHAVIKKTVENIRAFWQNSPETMKQYDELFSKMKSELADLEQDMDAWARTRAKTPDTKTQTEMRCHKFATTVAQTMFGGTIAIAMLLMGVLGWLVVLLGHTLFPDPNLLALIVAVVAVELVVGLMMFAKAAALAGEVKAASEPIALELARNWRGVLIGVLLVLFVIMVLILWGNGLEDLAPAGGLLGGPVNG
jgi:hypothetical protein